MIRIARSVGVQSGAAFAGQLAALLLVPALARLAPPAIFGGYAPYLSLTVIGSVVGLGRLEQVVLVARSRGDAQRLHGATAFGSLLGGAAVALGALALHDLAPVEAILAGGMYGATIVNRVWLLMAVRDATHGRIAAANFIEVSGTMVLQVLLLWSGQPGVQALIAGRLLALVAASAVVFPGDLRRLRWRGWRDAAWLARRYRGVVAADLPSSVGNTLSWQAPVLAIAAVWGDAGAGAYAMAYRLLRLPNRLIGDPVGRVFTSALVRGEPPLRLVRRYTGVLVGLAVALYGPLALAPDALAARVLGAALGDEWLHAVDAIRILAPWLGAAFALTHLGVVFLRTGGLRLLLGFNVALLASRVLVIGAGILRGDLTFLLWALSSTGVVVYACLYPLAIRSIARHLRQTAGAKPEAG
ncbi:MAG TPA: oligosaccharide flippase family protein [Candidatus Krumholzibacteria bacterium]|nr:oligosaccharide flippase family protein [Candidatus Krumholzibacteria bacterium]HPD71318.1 oligosaccharide flippase family protein [Candidatus Krumholzibacteria bacterium]HRY38982.1 oligosaccharide flippase family protein [Candidatus Krumholzibacteria bacterium]